MRFDFGTTYIGHKIVSEELFGALQNTMQLAGFASLPPPP